MEKKVSFHQTSQHQRDITVKTTRTFQEATSNVIKRPIQEIAVNAILTKEEWETMPGGLFDQANNFLQKDKQLYIQNLQLYNAFSHVLHMIY